MITESIQEMDHLDGPTQRTRRNFQPLVSTWEKQGSKKIQTHTHPIFYFTRKKANFLFEAVLQEQNIAQLSAKLVLR